MFCVFVWTLQSFGWHSATHVCVPSFWVFVEIKSSWSRERQLCERGGVQSLLNSNFSIHLYSPLPNRSVFKGCSNRWLSIGSVSKVQKSEKESCSLFFRLLCDFYWGKSYLLSSTDRALQVFVQKFFKAKWIQSQIIVALLHLFDLVRSADGVSREQKRCDTTHVTLSKSLDHQLYTMCFVKSMHQSWP